MKYFIYLLVSILSGFFLGSCGEALSTRLEIDPPEFESQMSLTTFIDAYNVQVNMFIGRNRGILDIDDFDEYGLDDAKLTITKESEGISIDTEKDGFVPTSGPFNYSLIFFNNEFFEPGDQYTFLLEHSDFESSITTLEFPTQGAVLENIVYKREDGLDEEFDQASSITFDIVDDPAKNDYYELEAATVGGGGNDLSFWISSLDPVARKGRPIDNILISDNTFNGERKTITIRFDRFLYNPEINDNIELRFRTVNEGFYKNSISLAKYYETEGTPFTSPVQVHSNVNKALGNISFKTTDIYIVE